MKALLAALFCTLSLALISQDTLYFDIDWNDVSCSEKAAYKMILDYSSNNPDEIVEKVYFPNGQLKSKKSYSSFQNKILHGQRIEWFRNGQMRRNMHYNNGKMHGELYSYYSNGQLKRHDNYIYGEFINGICFTSNGVETEHYDYLVMPEFPGGFNQLVRYLVSNTKYPKRYKGKGVEGIVMVNFNIDKRGNVVDIKIKQGVNKQFNKEAIRVVKKMPKWEPGMEDGELITVNYNLPISFKPYH